MKKAVIIAAGSADFIDTDGAGIIIAADGGYDNALRLGIMPDLFVGDMDSVTEKVDIEKVMLNKEKDFTDTEIAIEEAVLPRCMYAVSGIALSSLGFLTENRFCR